jgi:ArsR family transcriptional regulator
MDPRLRVLKATADPTRLRILRILREGPFAVVELTGILGVGQSSVSRHLRILSEAGLVEVRRSGTWAWYSLREEADAFPTRLLEVLSGGEPSLNGDQASVDRVLADRRRVTSELFRRRAPEWDRVREDLLVPSAHLEGLVRSLDGAATVVDLGTGTGALLARLAGRDRRVIGVDASAEMLELARERVQAQGPAQADLRLGTLEHLPLGDAEADAMVAHMVLHHVADPPGVLREIHRGLAAGGRLLVVDLQDGGEPSFWEALGAQWPGFRPDELRGWLERAGFQDIRFESAGPAAGRADRPKSFLLEATRASD